MEYVREGRQRVVVRAVRPTIDEGRFAVKRVVGDWIQVEALIFADGHEDLAAAVYFRREGTGSWHSAPMLPVGDDLWRGSFQVKEIGRHEFVVHGWIDHFHTWQRQLRKRVEAGQDVAVDLKIGAQILSAAADRAADGDRTVLQKAAALIANDADRRTALEVAFGADLVEAAARHPAPYQQLPTKTTAFPIDVDRPTAAFSSWYEMFPRSCSPTPGKHGTFDDAAARLPYVAEMGFDVVYLPPIHPIGAQFRKGKNNSLTCEPGEPGSCWAIGGKAGGHKSVLPELGTIADFRRFVAAAEKLNIHVALDVAFQCSPDHPWVEEHPEWFRRRPDGTIQYAENPPKKYQDIYPFDFETADWQALWEELRSVFLYWIEQGVTIFRVDNPHTKPLPFWEWLIRTVKQTHPETIFLAEAFTRPNVMYTLAKMGFTQSYTYFTWRTGKDELAQFFTEVANPPVNDFYRPNFWPNTPDILHEFLQTGGRRAFALRVVLAACGSANFGFYGPAYELCENIPVRHGSEEYLDSEKYEIKSWDLKRPDSLKPLLTKLNAIRKQHPALQRDRHMVCHRTEGEHLFAFSKRTDDFSDVVLTVVNLNPHGFSAGVVHVDSAALGLGPDQTYIVHDLLTGARYEWGSRANYVELSPDRQPAHVFHIER
ncbi:MAG: alpha-1,4-glucan--maltose-1-phosphate maltosyltransferase [Planctomycetia bacterium]